MKIAIVRLTGATLIGCAVFGVFLLINPATVLRVSPLRVAVIMPLFLMVGFGMVWLRKWTVVIFLLMAACATVFILKEAFRPDIWIWAIPINLGLLAIPTSACLASWRQLK